MRMLTPFLETPPPQTQPHTLPQAGDSGWGRGADFPTSSSTFPFFFSEIWVSRQGVKQWFRGFAPVPWGSPPQPSFSSIFLPASCTPPTYSQSLSEQVGLTSGDIIVFLPTNPETPASSMLPLPCSPPKLLIRARFRILPPLSPCPLCHRLSSLRLGVLSAFLDWGLLVEAPKSKQRRSFCLHWPYFP